MHACCSYILSYLAFPVVGQMPRGLQRGMKITAFSRCTMPVEAAQTAELRELVKSVKSHSDCKSN